MPRSKRSWGKELYGVEIYSKVRYAVIKEGMSQRQAAKHFGICRDMVSKMMNHSAPPGYIQSKPRRSILDPYKPTIDKILESDKDVHKKQRHTATRIFERLKEEFGYPGGVTIVKDYITSIKKRKKECFIPLSHQPGSAQFDFGEADVIIQGNKVRAHFFVMYFPYSDAYFMKCYPAENTEAFLDAHISSFKYFGGIPTEILYDNTKIAVKKVDEGPFRIITDKFEELVSHYLFKHKFAAVAKGNQKGHVEGGVGYVRRNYMVPMPRVSNWEELNQLLETKLSTQYSRQIRGKEGGVKKRFELDRSTLSKLPKYELDSSAKVQTSVNSQLLVRFDKNDYSVPFEFAYQDVTVKAFVFNLEIFKGTEKIAQHERLYDKGQISYNPIHYLPLLERKPRAIDQAEPLKGWLLDDIFFKLKDQFEYRLGYKGKREYIQVLRLMETFKMEEVVIAIEEAMRLGCISYDAIKMLVVCLIEKRPPRLDIESYPFLPKMFVQKTNTHDYSMLLDGGHDVR